MWRLLPFSSDDEDALDVEDAFGEHDVEYWIRSGNRLVPATPEQATALREWEALRRLERWRRAEAERIRASERQLRRAARLAAWIVALRWLAGAIRRPIAHAQVDGGAASSGGLPDTSQQRATGT